MVLGMKKLYAAMLAALLCACIAATGACEAALAFKPGDYAGEADGFGGKLTVNVTVDESSITAIEVTSHAETSGIGTNALDSLPGKIIDQQTLAVDAVAGCTVSSNALLAAVRDALDESGVDMSLLEIAPEQDAAQKDTVEITADVVVVGGGGAGVAAALSAAEQGANVVVLEKTTVLGGTTLLSGAYYACGNQEVSKKAEMNDLMRADVEEMLAMEPLNDDMARWQAAVKEQYESYKASGATYMFDSEEYHMLQVFADGYFTGDTALIERYCAASYECYTWLENHGLTWSTDIIAGKASDSGVVTLDAQRARRNKAKGEARNSQLIMDVLKNGCLNADAPVEFMMEVAGQKLIVENDRVTGVQAVGGDGTPYILHATKGVILATGGIGSNVELMRKYNSWYPVIPDTLATDNSAGDTGDGLMMADEIGVELIDMGKLQMFIYGTKYQYGMAPYVSNYTNMLVNCQGERFVNETASDRELAAAMLAQPGGVNYILSDANSSVIKEGKNTAGYEIDKLIEAGLLMRADSIEELAGMIGADPSVLKASVDTFNAACDAGKDEVFGRTVFHGTEKLTQAPFYAAVQVPAEHHSMGGIHVDTQMRALKADGTPFAGLYAAGEICGGLQGDDRISGNAILEAFCGGMIAGRTVNAD